MRSDRLPLAAVCAGAAAGSVAASGSAAAAACAASYGIAVSRKTPQMTKAASETISARTPDESVGSPMSPPRSLG